MRLIFIRHAEPDYSTDTLTELGQKEAEALAERTARWKVDEIFCSPMGRARETAYPTLKALHMEAAELPWLREFSYPVMHPYQKAKGVAWDLMPQYWTNEPVMLSRDRWFEAPLYRENPDLEKMWYKVCDGLGGILERYGYTRLGDYYDYRNPDGPERPAGLEDIQLHGTKEYEVRDRDDEKTLVFFCHLGVTCVMLAHLLNVSPVLLWHGTFLPPAGLVVMNAEKRLHNAAFFRMQAFGDTAHLLQSGVKLSGYGAFSTVFRD